MAKAGRSMAEKAVPTKATPSKRKVPESVEGACTPRKKATPRKKSVGGAAAESAAPRRTPRKTPVKNTPGKGRGRKSLSQKIDENQQAEVVVRAADCSAAPPPTTTPAPALVTQPRTSHHWLLHMITTIATVILSALAGWFACRLSGGTSETPRVVGSPSLAPSTPLVESQKKEVVEKIRQRMERKLVFA